jgi:hypothetical protein
MQFRENVTVANEAGRNDEHPFASHRNEMPIFNQAANLALSSSENLNEVGYRQPLKVVENVMCHSD